MGCDDIKKKQITQNRKRRQQNRYQRKQKNLQVIPNILILTEGYTEYNYFLGLKNHLELNTVQIEKSSHTDMLGIIEEAKSKASKSSYTMIFCITDLDTVKNFNNIPAVPINIEETVIFPVLSYPCIEVWLILHHEVCDKPFNSRSSNSIGDEVKSYYKQNYDSGYTEASYDALKEIIPLYNIAINNAIKLEKIQTTVLSYNPITSVHNLVSLLENISNRTNDYHFNDKTNSFIRSLK